MLTKMKELKITKIALSYFKGIHNLTLSTDHDVVSIHADNGKGKTTIADAIQWVLFNKDSKGRTQFKIRTMDSEGNYIPNVETSVTLDILIDGLPHTLKKELVAKASNYTSDKQELSTTAKYYVDGQVYTKKDFDQYIADIATEDTFRSVTSPTFFFSLDWKKQRAILTSLVNEPATGEINANHEYDFVEEALRSQQFASLEALSKHISYQLKEVKTQLDVIPLQIDEQTRTMPEPQDWEGIRNSVAMLTTMLENKQKELIRLKSTPADDARLDNIRKQISFQQRRVDEMRRSARTMCEQSRKEYNENCEKQQGQLTSIVQNIRDLDFKLQGITRINERLQEVIRAQEAEQAKIRVEWAENQKPVTITKDAIPSECPVCGHAFSMEHIEEEKEKMRQAYLLDKAKKKSYLLERATKTKQIIADSEAEIAQGTQELEKLTKTVADSEKKMAELENTLANLPAPPTADELLSRNPGYQDAMQRIKELEKELETPSQSTQDTDNSSEIDKIELEIIETKEELQHKQQHLASESVFNAHTKRIEELQQKQKELRLQLDNLQRQADQCLGYELRYGELLEQQINAKFSIVSFSLFKHLVNGSTEPYCEPLVDGIPVSTNVNSASRMNAGLDICNTFAKHIGLSAPVIIDNSEGNNNIIPTIGQQIRLYVSHDKSLTIK